MRRARLQVRAAAFVLALALPSKDGVEAQTANSGPAGLPRPGYDPPPPIRLGTTAVRLTFDLSALYDSNVYATHTAARDDGVIQAGLRATATNEGVNRVLQGEAHVNRNQHIDIKRETTTTFGALVSGRVNAARDQLFNGIVRYDRTIESRSDPETRANASVPPGKIDIIAADGSFAYHPFRLGADLSIGARSYNYLDRNEHDRDMRSYQAALRLSWKLRGPLSAFVEPFVSRRDFVTRVDRSGVDRDATTIGGLLGIAYDGTAALHGRIGAGLFRFEPDSPVLRPFQGFAANGELTWSPRRRTSITGSVFSGDAATVRAGATGRHDSSVSLRLDQEVRHNLLMDAGLSWEQTRYRGAKNSNRDTLRFQAGATYLVNRTIALFAEGSITHRSAVVDINSFNRHTLSLGIRFQR